MKKTNQPIGHRNYAGPAARKLRELTKVLNVAADYYEAMPYELQSLVDTHIDMALSENPLLNYSVAPPDRPVLMKLLFSGRFHLALRAVGEASALGANTLESVGKPVDPKLLYLPDTLPTRVRKGVQAAACQPRRPFGGLFQRTGAPKEKAIRRAVSILWPIYEEKTGKKPKVYPTAYCTDGYGGKFYEFAKEILVPLRLIPKNSLPSAIYTAYKEHRDLLLGHHRIPPKNRKTHRQ